MSSRRLKGAAKLAVMALTSPLLLAFMVLAYVVAPAAVFVFSAFCFVLWLVLLASWAVPVGLMEWAFADETSILRAASQRFTYMVTDIWASFYREFVAMCNGALREIVWKSFIDEVKAVFLPEPEAIESPCAASKAKALPEQSSLKDKASLDAD